MNAVVYLLSGFCFIKTFPNTKLLRSGMMSKLHVQDLTQGSITQKLLVFALPYLFANLIQALYGAVDMIVVGWFDSAAGISAVSIGSQVMQILTSMVAGLTMGSTILIAQYSGARRQEETVRTISTTLTLFALLAVFLPDCCFSLLQPFFICCKHHRKHFLLRSVMSESVPAALFLSLVITPSALSCADWEIPKTRSNLLPSPVYAISSLTLPLLEESKWELSGLHWQPFCPRESVCCSQSSFCRKTTSSSPFHPKTSASIRMRQSV